MPEAPSIERAIRGLPAAHQDLLRARYEQILPILLRLLKPRDIWERNRTWPGVSPQGKGATKLLLTKSAGKMRRAIKRRIPTDQHDLFWKLIRAYCQFGPLGLIEPEDSNLPSLIPEELLELARFHRIGKHPRSDAGSYIRELLNSYAKELGFEALPPFVARYAFVTNRKLKHWFIPDDVQTEHVPKTIRRLNRDLPYPHQQWNTFVHQLTIPCSLCERHPQRIVPWLIWIEDAYTKTLQGVQLSATEPQIEDIFLAFRWAIWHFGAPWWPSRGVPNRLGVQGTLGSTTIDHSRGLRYTHTELMKYDIREPAQLPSSIASWLDKQGGQTRSKQIPHLLYLQESLLSHLQELQVATISTATPQILRAQGISLPWGRGLAAALMLPSAGNYTVDGGLITIYGIPYMAKIESLVNGEVVEVRYNPDDARHIYVIKDPSRVIELEAARFEGARVLWVDLLEKPSLAYQSQISN